MYPQRKLHEQIIQMIKEEGLPTHTFERRLNLNSGSNMPQMPGRGNPNSSPNGKAAKAKVVKKKRVSSILEDDGIKAIEREINNPNNLKKLRKAKKKQSVGTDPSEVFIHPETGHQFYEKELPRTDMFNYGTLIEKDGLHPMRFINLINFQANITALIGSHFKKKERIERDVLIEYLTNDGKRINQFNEEIEGEIMPGTEIQKRYENISRFQSLQDAAEVKRRPGLGSEAHKRQQKIITDKRHTLRDEETQANNEKAAKELSILKEQQRQASKPVIHDHIKHKAYNTTFAGIQHLFSSLFGS